jgi:hypothetical protein
MLQAIKPDQLVPAGHPIRKLKPIVDRALRSLSPTFSAVYARGGRKSIPPEHLLKASLLLVSGDPNPELDPELGNTASETQLAFYRDNYVALLDANGQPTDDRATFCRARTATSPGSV